MQKSGARTFRANALDMLGRYAEAVAAYEEVIEGTSDWWEAHANLGICHARNGGSGEGGGHLQAGPGGLSRLAGDQGRTGGPPSRPGKNLPEALKLSEEAVALGRDEIRHLITLGEARLALEDEAGPAEAYQAVLGPRPREPGAHLELGILNERKGRMERAEEHFVESLKADPANPRALYSYASLYYTADDLEVAEEILERAIAADARYSPALSALASIQAAAASSATPSTTSRGPSMPARATSSTSGARWSSRPLHADPRFRTLLSRMVGDRRNGQG